MVWFDESGRMALCESGCDGFVDKAMQKPNTGGSDGFTSAQMTPCISGFDGFVMGWKK